MNQNEGTAFVDIARARAPVQPLEAQDARPATQTPSAVCRLLTFRDPALESEYLEREFQGQRKAIIINIVIAGLLLAAFAALDSVLLPAEVLGAFGTARFAVQLPLLALAVVVIARCEAARVQIHVTILMMTVCQLCWPVLLALGGPATLGYLSLALIQTTIGTYFMVGLPVRWSIPIVALVCSLFLGVAVVQGMPPAPTIMYGVGWMTIAIIGGFGAFRAENAMRRQFIATRRSEAEYRERLAAEAELNRWLTRFADVLRHELKNAIVGVDSSLQLVQLSAGAGPVSQYVARGQRSVAFMRKLLDQVANATTLEAALEAQTLEALDLSEMLDGLIADFERDHADWRVEAQLVRQLSVAADPDRLMQMFQKLFDNAVAHGDRAWPLRVTLGAQDGHAVISIANRGDALPEPVDSVFDAFTSSKRERSASMHLGLGLYVARTIITSHRGTISAQRLDNPSGAAFTLRLPLAPPAGEPHDSTQR